MPNGSLYELYGKSVLKAGKVLYPVGHPKRETHSKSIRYAWAKNSSFKLLEGKKRIKVVYLNEEMSDSLKSKLSIIREQSASYG